MIGKTSKKYDWAQREFPELLDFLVIVLNDNLDISVKYKIFKIWLDEM